MPGRPFKKEAVAIVPDEFVSGSVLMALDAEFKRTRTCPTGIEFLLDDWKSGRIRMGGVLETQEVFDHSGENREWHCKTFAKAGAPWSIFYAVVILTAEGTPDVGWTSPAVDRVCCRWVRSLLDPDARAVWSGESE